MANDTKVNDPVRRIFVIDKSDYEFLRERCHEQRISINEKVRELIKDYIKEVKYCRSC